jgi:hypothetical protein
MNGEEVENMRENGGEEVVNRFFSLLLFSESLLKG